MNLCEEDLLLTRVAERRASPEDWDELHRRAASETDLWARLHEWLEDDARIRAAVSGALAGTERVGLPAAGPRLLRGTRLILAAAALLFSFWLGTFVMPAAPAPTSDPLPSQVVGVQGGPDGLELVLVRPQVERAPLGDVFQLAFDEHGEVVPVRVDPAVFKPAKDF